ncbi:MAG TPA: hypothetical protein VG502_08760 [Flexivirga sp.]|uniref:hypothetical protein n=1 Tax=Flexivirga sp. TaxID=1962927 RepID=UPI002C884490|nr:hypothetical protein [Flexivirga sp.]HWC22373.1 hypothetical protein [Flexivirga sp.]
MTGRASGLLGSLWWLFAIAAVFFVGLSAFGVFRYATTDPAYTAVRDVTNFSTPVTGDRPTLYLLLPEEVAGPLPANQPQCRSAAGQHWHSTDLSGVSATRGGTKYTSVLQLPKGWRTGDRITCTGVTGPALLAAQDKQPALIMAGVGAVAAVLAAGFAIAGLALRPRRRVWA